MQVRFDGYIGFPGGLVEAGEDPEFSLNRELEEEMNLDLTKYSIQLSNHVVSHYNKKTRLVTHFYAMEVSMEELNNIESRALQAKEYGFEVCYIIINIYLLLARSLINMTNEIYLSCIQVFGNIRVPLFTMGDGYRGFPNFLKHKFIGYAKEQLLFTLKCLDLMSEDEIQRALTAVQ